MFNSSIRRSVASLVLPCLLITVSGCGDSGASIRPTEPSTAPNTARYNGEQLYRGIYLASGPVADLIPEIRDHLKVANVIKDPQQLALISDMQDRIVVGIHRNDPGFFNRFELAVRSGDRVQIDRAYREAGKVTVAAVTALPQVQEFRRRLANDPALKEQIRSAVDSKVASEPNAEDREYMADLVLAQLVSGGDFSVQEEESGILVAFALVATVAAVINYVVAAQIAVAVEVVATAVATVDATSVSPTPSVRYERIIDTVARTF